MGLSNSIYLHTRKKINVEKLPEYVKITDADYVKHEPGEFIYELCYFRKSWSFRDAMLKIVRPYHTIDIEGGDYDLPANKEIINSIQDALCHFLKHPYDWNRRSEVFAIEEVKNSIAQYILNLSWLQIYIEENDGAWLSFWDSF